MTHLTSTATETEVTSRDSIIDGIMSALGITASDAGVTRTDMIIMAIESLTTEQLAMLLDVSKIARKRSLSENSALRSAASGETPEPFTGEDCWRIRDLIFLNDTNHLFLLAAAIDRLPDSMSLRDALVVIKKVDNEMFDVSNPELLGAHLRVAGSLETMSYYTAHVMLMVNMHPDKTDAIISLIKGTNTPPTHRDVVVRHRQLHTSQL